jgi:hypothetical protein
MNISCYVCMSRDMLVVQQPLPWFAIMADKNHIEVNFPSYCFVPCHSNDRVLNSSIISILLLTINIPLPFSMMFFLL